MKHLSNTKILITFGALAVEAWSQTTLSTFTLQEPTNNSWPGQPIEMRYDGGYPNLKTTRMIGPDGVTEVPYQWISSCVDRAATKGCILVRDSLAAGASNTYTLQSGVAPAATVANAVAVTKVSCAGGNSCWQVTNGRTGLRIPASQPSPYNLAPIQGIQEADGVTWTATGSPANLLYAESPGSVSNGMLAAYTGTSFFRTPLTGAGGQLTQSTAYTVQFIEAGPMKTVIQAQYQFNRPDYYTGGANYIQSCGTTIVNGVAVPNTITFTPGTASQPPYSPMMVKFNLHFGTLCAGLAQNVYYVATIVPGSMSTYTLTMNGSPVAITGAPTGSPLAYYIVNSATGCSSGCTNASQGHYTATFTLYSDSKSIIVDEDTDIQFAYYLPISAGFDGSHPPDAARYRGFGVGSNTGTNYDALCGYDSPYTVTAASNTSPVQLTLSGSLYGNGLRAILRAVGGPGGTTIADGEYYLRTSGSDNGLTFTPISPGVYTNPGLTSRYTGLGAYLSGGTVKASYTGQVSTTGHDPVYDAYFDITYGADAIPGPSCTTNSSGNSIGTVTGNVMLMADYPPNNVTGAWSFEAYLSSQGSSGPVLGWYTGDFGKLWYVRGVAMPGLYTSNADFIANGANAYLAVITALRTSSNGVVGCAGSAINPGGTNSTQSCLNRDGTVNITGGNNYSVHRNWGIFVSTQSDLFPATVHQPISDDQNALTGINLSRLYSYGTLNFADPPQYYYPYLSTSAMNAVISAVQNGDSLCNSSDCYDELYNNSTTDALSRSLLTLWKNDDLPHLQAAISTFQSGPYSINTLGQALAAGDNHWDNTWGYYQLGTSLGFPALSSLGVFAKDPNWVNLSSTYRAQAKAPPALFANLIYDDDWFPSTNITGDGSGLSNQVAAYSQYRSMAAILLRYYPTMSSRVAGALTTTVSQFQSYFTPYGANPGSTNYASAYFFTPFAAMQANAMAGGPSIGTYAGWAAFPRWELSLQTPPEPRFGGVRKEVGMGAGADAAYQYRAGMAAGGLYSTNPTLAGNLMWAWRQSNNPSYGTCPGTACGVLTHNSTVPSLLATDITVPPVVPNITSLHIPGVFSHSRYGFNGAHETALWFINGAVYNLQGHRDYDDGQVTLYAHNVPLALDYMSNMTVPVSGMYLHNKVVFDSELTALNIASSWSADGPSTANGELSGNPTNTRFAAFSESTKSCASFLLPSDGTTWLRCVLHFNGDPAYPLIYVSDIFSGASASAGKTLSWNMMADHTQPVTIPVSPGSVTATARVSACGSVPSAYPSAGAVYNLPTGWQQFSFAGYNWPAHPTGGINWDTWINVPAGDGQFFVGNWGHGPNCEPVREQAEYNAANATSGYYEQQDILRVHSTGTFGTIVAPYRKTEPPTRTLSNQTCGIQIVQGAQTTCFNDTVLTYTNGSIQVLTVYDSSSQSAFGMSASGGAQELVNNGSGTITWTVSDVTPGTRCIGLPAGTWYPSAPVQLLSGGQYCLYHDGGVQPTPSTVTFSNVPTPIHTVVLGYSAPPGANQVAVQMDGAHAALANCSPGCSVSLQAPAGTHIEQHSFRDSNGTVTTASQPITATY